ncbi:MAG TPA: outer membrane lipoprotein-sorting protein [Treponema sp.]|nr:outer membrane lipoprotein-sorting protein [Treponema sp.]
MKKTGIAFVSILSGLLLAANAAFADTKLSAADAAALLKKTDETTAFTKTDFSAKYSIVQDKPGQGKSVLDAVMYRRDRASSYTILITGPAKKDKGKGYVQFDNNIWYYDPADKQFVFTSAQDKFQGSNANNSDFTPQHYSRDYTIAKATRVTLGKLSCVLFELNAAVEDVSYPTIKLWVTEDDGLIRKREDYSLSGQLLRTTLIPKYQSLQKYKEYSVPESMTIIDNLRGKKINNKMQYEQTVITITLTKDSFEKQSDAVYTKKYVEMMSK